VAIKKIKICELPSLHYWHCKCLHHNCKTVYQCYCSTSVFLRFLRTLDSDDSYPRGK